MPLLKIQDDKFQVLIETTLEQEKIFEVRHIQRWLSQSIETLDNRLKVISTEFHSWDCNRSIDILCIDTNGDLVVVELKRSKDAHMELQALRYAAMVSNMTFDNIVNEYRSYLQKIGSPLQAEQDLIQFLDKNEISKDEFAQDVRIILLAANFSRELISSVLWLNNQKGLDISCYQLSIFNDEQKIFFNIQKIIPLANAEDYQIQFRVKNQEERENRIERKKERSLIKQLFEEQKLNIGDIIFLDSDFCKKLPRRQIQARITNLGVRCLQIDDEAQLFSLSGLRKYLVNKLNITDINPDWGFSLKNDWKTIKNEQALTLEQLLVMGNDE